MRSYNPTGQRKRTDARREAAAIVDADSPNNVRLLFAMRDDPDTPLELRTRIMANEDAAQLTMAARRYGMYNLREDGWRKIRMGITTVGEVMRVTQEL